MSIPNRTRKIVGLLTAVILMMSQMLFLPVPVNADSVWTVTNAYDGAGSATDITLRYAMTHALPGDTIQFADSVTGQCYYTTDGSDPRTSNTRVVYSGSITVSQTRTIKAANYSSSTGWSDVTTSDFIIGGTTSPWEPVIFPREGSFDSAQTVHIYSPGAVNLYYTTDGTNPETSVTRMSCQGSFASVTVSQSARIKAVASYGSAGTSRIAEACFTIGGTGLIQTPVITPNGGEFSGPMVVDLFNRSGTLYLSSPLPKINKNLTISGPGADSLAISGNYRFRVFEVIGGNVSISGLTVENGWVYGNPGANGGDGIAGGGGGGGGAAEGGGGLLVKGGALTLDGVRFLNNLAIGGAGGSGGAAWTGGQYDYGDGGNGGTSDLHDGSAGGQGGIASFPPVSFGIFQLSDGRTGAFAADGVKFGGGGGGSGFNRNYQDIYFAKGGNGGMSVDGSIGTYYNNTAGTNGTKGGNGGTGGYADITDGDYYGGNGGNGGDAYGGAICLIDGAVQVINSSFTGNGVLGGVGGPGGPSGLRVNTGYTLNSFIFSIGGSLLSGNRGDFSGLMKLCDLGLSAAGTGFNSAAGATVAYPYGGFPGNGGNAAGGAIYVSPYNSSFGWNGAPLVIVNSTFNDNVASGGYPGPTTDWAGIPGSYGQSLAHDIANYTNSSHVAVRNVAGATSTFGEMRTLNGPSPVWSRITASSLTAVTDGTASVTITVNLRDTNNMPVWGEKVVLDQGSGHSIISPASAVTDKDGNAIFTVTGTRAETIEYSAIDAAVNLTVRGKLLWIWDGHQNVASTESTVAFTPGPPSAAKSTVSASPSTVLSNGADTATITVTIKDVCGNPLTGKTVSLDQGAGHSSVSPASAVTDSSGMADFTATGSVAETVTYTATVHGDNVAVSQSATVTFAPYAWIVDSLNDTQSPGTLRHAISNAPSGTVIKFENGLSGTILLSSPLPAINRDLVIDGSGTSVTISGSGQYRVFQVDSGTVSIQNLTVINGKAAGTDGATGGNSPTYGYGYSGENGTGAAGGALLLNGGTVTLRSVAFNNNRAAGGDGGKGGDGNKPGTQYDDGGNGGNGGYGYGGAIALMNGSLTVSDCTFTGNQAAGGSGGLGGSGTGVGGQGGNAGPGLGGAIYAGSGTLMVSNCRFTGGSVSGGSGGNAGTGGPYSIGGAIGGNGANGFGGAVFTGTASLAVTDSEFSSNTATGGSRGTGARGNGTAGNATGLDLYNQSGASTLGRVAFGSGNSSYYNALPAHAAMSTATANPAGVNADGVTFSTITVTLKYANGDPAGCGKQVLLIPDRGSTIITAANGGVTDSSGMVTFTVADTKSETVTYTIRDLTDNIILTQSVSVNFLPADAVLSTVRAAQADVPADGTTSSTIIVMLKYADGSAASGKTVTLSQGGGSSTIKPAAAVVTDSSGIATFTVTDTKLETVTYTAKDTTDNIPLPQTVTVCFLPPDADLSTVTADRTSLPADGSSTATITVVLKYFNGKPVSGKVVTLSQGNGNSSIVPSATATTDSNGKAAFTVASNTAGTVKYTVKDTTDNVTLTQEATVTFQPYTWSVTTLTDGSSPGTLRYAMTQAPAGAAITFENGLTGVLRLTSPLPAINRDLSIAGPGAASLTISGDDRFPVFQVDSGTVSITGLTIVDGRAAGADGEPGPRQWHGDGYLSNGPFYLTGGGPGGNGGDGKGGGLRVMNGVVSVEDVIFRNNRATGGNGGNGNDGSDFSSAGWGGNGGSGSGGAIYLNAGSLTIRNSQFDGNSAAGGSGGNGGSNFYYGAGGNGGNGSGGAIYVNTGSLVLSNSGFTGDSVTGSSAGTHGSGDMMVYATSERKSGVGGSAYGADLYNRNGIVTISQVTFGSGSSSFYNFAPADAGRSTVTASPSSILADGAASSTITVTLRDAGGNPVNGKTVILSGSLGGGQGSGNSSIAPSNTATTDSDGKATFTVTDSHVETVTYTAVDTTDHVTVTGTAVVTFSRVDYVINTLSDTNDPGTLRYALGNAQPGAIITFQAGLFGTLLLQSPLPAINQDLTIDGSGSGITLSGNNLYRVFQVDSGTVSIQNMTIVDSRTAGNDGANSSNGSGGAGGNGLGGALLIMNGAVSLQNVAFENNQAVGGNGGSGYYSGSPAAYGGYGFGGAIYLNSGTLTITNGSFIGNRATGGAGGYFQYGNSSAGGPGYGGAIYVSSGTVMISDCQFDNNDAMGGSGGSTGWNGSGAVGGSGYGGAIYVNNAAVTVSNCRFDSSSTSGGNGGSTGGSGSGANGGSSFGGGIFVNAGSLEITNSVFAGGSISGGNGGSSPAAGVFNYVNGSPGSASGLDLYNQNAGVTVNSVIFNPGNNSHYNLGTLYTITFVSQGGSPVSNLSTNVLGSTITAPANPAKAGCIFGGWYKDSACTDVWDFGTDTVTGDISLYALWTVTTYTIAPISNQTLTSIAPGYASGTQETRTIMVTRTGNGDLTNLSAALSGADAGSFDIIGLSVTALNANTPSATFTVKAKDALALGMYTATVTISADHMTPVTFTVTQAVSTVVSAAITPASGAFDKESANQADVSTTITWNDAASVTGIKKSGVSLDPTDYSISGNTLTVKQSYLAAQAVGSLDLTVEFDKGDAATFTIAITGSAADKVAADKVLLQIVFAAGDHANAVTQNLTLAAAGSIYGSVITWNSNNTAVISDTGVVTRPAYSSGDANVTLTASINNSGVIDTKDFSVKVLRLPPPAITPPSATEPEEETLEEKTPEAEIAVSGNNVISTTTATATTDSSGMATAAVTQAQVSDAVGKAETEAAKRGEGAAATVEIQVTAPDDAITVEVGIPGAAVGEIADHNVGLEVSTPIASITFDANALDTISQAAAGEVKVTAAKVDTAELPEETRQVVGDRPVFNFSITSGNNPISQFGGNVSVSLPYTPKAGEDPNAIVIYYINAEGKPEIVSHCACDPATGSITFVTNHFSRYAIGYNPVSFTDVPAAAGYSKAVAFIAARGITQGTGNGKFSPDAKLTRGEFIVMMMRAFGIAPDVNPKENFADVGNTDYTGYLAAAKRLGISAGVGNNRFAPGREITRQELFTLLYNALKVTGQLPKGKAGKPLSAFSDANQIAAGAKEAMTLFAETGIIQGSGRKLNPKAAATRAQMAQVLYNLLSK